MLERLVGLAPDGLVSVGPGVGGFGGGGPGVLGVLGRGSGGVVDGAGEEGGRRMGGGGGRAGGDGLASCGGGLGRGVVGGFEGVLAFELGVLLVRCIV